MTISDVTWNRVKTNVIGGLLVAILIFSGPARGGSDEYWPTEKWPVSTPEEQGMSSEVLADMLSAIVKESPDSIDSVTVIRNGFIVLDAYFYPYQKNAPHIIHSCTKSITSTLVGIAIDKGYIKDVGLKLLDIFPEITPDHMTPEKEKIDLENILTMRTGLDCRDSYKYKWQGLGKMRRSNDWTKYMLDLPMKEAPGQKFEYCNGASYLLSAIIQKKTGMQSLQFAMDNLFSPLGIADVRWEANPGGINVGYGEMWLKPHDMAKFGWLFLKKGKWDGKTIVSEKWVEAATRGHGAATLYSQYGYQWWIGKAGYYVALGYGGQRIFVIPEFNMVAVLTSYKAFKKADLLMKDYIVRSVESAKPLPSNADGYRRLKELVEINEAPPEPSATEEHSALSKAISGARYKIDGTRMGFTGFSFDFGQDKNIAQLEYEIGERRNTAQVGLDGIYRITDLQAGKVALKGNWVNENSFKLSYRNVGHTEGLEVEIKFREDNADVNMIWPSGFTRSITAAKD